LEFVRYKQQAIVIPKGQTGRVNDSRMTGAPHHVDQAALAEAVQSSLPAPAREGGLFPSHAGQARGELSQ
jgi:hypothetical protein